MVQPRLPPGSKVDDQPWHHVHLAHLIERGVRLWLHCQCTHGVMVDPVKWSQIHAVGLHVPLRTIGTRLRCSACGRRGCSAWPESVGEGDQK